MLTLSMLWLGLTPTLFPSAETNAQVAAPHPGFFAPDFTLSSIEGKSISLSDYEDRVVLMLLWAYWCSVCKSTMPGLQEVFQDYASQGFEVLAVNMTFQDNLEEAVNFYQSENLTYPFLLDQNGNTARAYQLHALPTAVLIDQEGIVLDVIIGSGISSGLLRSQLDQLLLER